MRHDVLAAPEGSGTGRPRCGTAHLPFVALAAIATSLPAQHREPLPAPFESYVAHIAAAEGALARAATGAARRWLDAVPEPERAFEWRMLDAEADQSTSSFLAHPGGVATLALSPDGRVLATGGNDGLVKLWDAATFAPLRTIEAQRHAIYCLAFDAEGKRLASSSADRGAKIWDVASGAPISAFTKHTYPVTTIRFAPDGRRVCSTSYQRPKGGEVRVWDAATGEEITVLQSGYAPITCSHWNADGTKIVAASWDQHLHVFDLAAPTEPIVVRLGPEPEYRAAQASALSPDGTVVAVACKDDCVHLFEAWTGKALRDLVGHRKIVEGVAFSPDGATIASVSADTSVRLWDAASGRPLADLRGHSGLVRGVAFTTDGATLLTGGADGMVRTWNVATACAKNRRLEFEATAYHVAESPDGSTLAVGFANGDLRLFATADGTQVARLPGHDGWIGCLRWSLDGARLLTGGEKQLLVFDVASRKVERSLGVGESAASPGWCDGVDAVDWTADGRWIAAVSRDQKGRGWDGATGELRWTVDFAGVQTRLEFSPDGSVLAVCGHGGASLLDPTTGTVRAQLKGHRGRVSAIRFTPDGQQVATLGEDGGLRFWNAASGAVEGSVVAHDGAGRAAYVSPDGRRLVTCGEDDRLVLWDVATRAEVWSRDVKDGYCLAWSRDGDRVWVLPLGKHAFCLDAVPLRLRAH